MKLTIAPLLLLVFTLFSCISASPVLSSNTMEGPLINAHALVERSLKFPCKADDALVAKIMTNVKADLDAKVFAQVSATFCEQAGASIHVHATLLGGMIKIQDAHIKAIESAALKNVKGNFEASLHAEVQDKIYASLEVSLRKSLGKQILDQAKLLNILIDLESKAQGLIKVQLPKIGVSLRTKAKEQVEVAVKGVEVNIPLRISISVDVNINEKVTLDASVAAGLKMCAKLNAKATASAILSSL